MPMVVLTHGAKPQHWPPHLCCPSCCVHGAEPRGDLGTHTFTHTEPWAAKYRLVAALALFRVPPLMKALPGAALALPSRDRPANSPSLPQSPSRTDPDLNTIIHFSHKQLQRVTGHPGIFFPALLRVTAHCGGAAWEGRAACYPLF